MPTNIGDLQNQARQDYANRLNNRPQTTQISPSSAASSAKMAARDATARQQASEMEQRRQAFLNAMASNHGIKSLGPRAQQQTSAPQDIRSTLDQLFSKYPSANQNQYYDYTGDGTDSNTTSLPTFNKSLSDYLAEAQGMYKSSLDAQLANIAARQKQMQDSAGLGDSRLQQMYAGLHNLNQQGMDADTARYAAAQAASKQATADAQAALNASNASLKSVQDATAQNLGTTGTAASQGTQNDYMQMNNSGLQTSGNAAMQNLIAKGLAQTDYGRAMLTAGDFTGTSRRADLQSALQKALADLSAQSSSVRASSYNDAVGLAQQLYNADRSAFNQDRQFEANRSDAAAKQAYNQGYLDYLNSKSTGTGGSSSGASAAMATLQQNGVDPNASDYIMNLIAQGAQNAGNNKAKGMGSSNYAEFMNLLQNDGQLSPQQKSIAAAVAQQAYGSY